MKRKNLVVVMLKCRAYGHSWDDRGWVAMLKSGVRGYDQLLTCERCLAKRTDFRARATLKLISRSYEYPIDYPGNVKQGEALKIVINSDTEKQRNVG